MSGLEGPALSLAGKLGWALMKRLAKSEEFDRLCARLAERFGERTGFSSATFKDWGHNEAFMSALAEYMLPPHEFHRSHLIAAITPLVGPVSANTTAEEFAGEVADAIRDEMRVAKEGDALVRFEVDRVLQVAAAAPVAFDPSWAPGRARATLERLLSTDPAAAARLESALKGRNARVELPGLIDVPPAWARDGSAEQWRALARFAEVVGCWPQARRAWEACADSAGADRARALLGASDAAARAGDPEAAERLREQAKSVNPGHPLIRRFHIEQEDDPEQRLRLLAEVPEPEEPEHRAMLLASRTLALLDAGRTEEATVAARAASDAAPQLPAVLEATAAVVLARNGVLRQAGRGTERSALAEAAKQYAELRELMQESRRYAESGAMLQRQVECLMLADRVDEARSSLDSVMDEELVDEVPLDLAATALSVGDPDGSEQLLGRYAGNDEAADLLWARAKLRRPETRVEAVDALDRKVEEGNREAAFIRLVAAVPGTDDVAWSDAAESLVREAQPALASYLKADWHERRGRAEEARRELARHAHDPRALEELLRRAAESREWRKAAALARALLAAEPGIRQQVRAAQVLLRTPDAQEAEPVLRRVWESADANDDERGAAFDGLADLLLRAARYPDAVALADEGVAAGKTESGWLAAYGLVRQGSIAAARTRIEGLTPRGAQDARLGADLHFAVDPPRDAVEYIGALAASLDEPDEEVEIKLTLALLRCAREDITPELIQRAGPASFVKRFPDSDIMRAEKIPEGDEALVARIQELTEGRAQDVREAEQHIFEFGDWPVGTLAIAAGKSLAETWPALPALPLAYGTPEELEKELAAARTAAGGPVLADTAALATLRLLDPSIADAAFVEFPLSGKSQGVLDDLMNATAFDLTDNGDTVLWLYWDEEAGRPGGVELTGVQAAAPRRAAEEMLALAERLATVTPATSIPQDDSIDDDPIVVRTYRDTLASARAANYPVYSDDRVFRATLTGAGIATFGTPALLQMLRETGALTEEDCELAMRTLRERRALGVKATDEQTQAEDGA